MSRRPWWRSRWWMPAVSLLLGGLILAAMAAGGNGTDGLKAFAVMAVVAAGFAFGVMAFVAALFFFGRRSETLQGLGGPARDERWAMIDVHATALSGMVLVLVIIGAWLYEIAGGRDGSPYGQLGAVGGVSYVLAVALLRRRS